MTSAAQNRRSSAPAALFGVVVLLLALLFHAGLTRAQESPPAEITPERAEELFSQIDAMLESIEEITGLAPLRPIPRELITREAINELVASRLKEETEPDELRVEELFLRLFGFVGPDFNLEEQIVEVLTEQATALYDYKTKKLYLSTWVPQDMQEYALVHELAHAVADQHFDLGKYLARSKSSDSDLARSAVIEGQASWIMTEWVFQQSGRSLIDSGPMVAAAVGASRYEAETYPVFASQPLYLRETLLFPYTQGMLFQHAALLEEGRQAFGALFERPPLSTQHVLEPDTYFSGRKPVQARLPKMPKLRRFSRIARGDVGHLDHHLLLMQHVGEDEAATAAPAWRGGRYEIWENQSRTQAVLRYASVWESPEAAERFFRLYRKVCEAKWDGAVFEKGEPEAGRLRGSAGNGDFIVGLDGTSVWSLEGLPPARRD